MLLKRIEFGMEFILVGKGYIAFYSKHVYNKIHASRLLRDNYQKKNDAIQCSATTSVISMIQYPQITSDDFIN